MKRLGGGGGVCGSDDSKHAVSVQGHADYAPNWVAEPGCVVERGRGRERREEEGGVCVCARKG